MSEVVGFYRVTDPHGCFSNFAPYPIEMDGVVWPTSEHWFQAQKFVGTTAESEMAGAIRAEPSPMKAALMGRDRTKPRRNRWETIRDDVMRRAVRAKFTQHAHIRDVLLGTGNAAIVEHTANDDYWGDGGDGSGVNMLGRILVEVREEFRRQAESMAAPEPKPGA